MNPAVKNRGFLGVCIPGGMKLYLEHFDEMPEHVQDFVMSRIKALRRLPLLRTDRQNREASICQNRGAVCG